jgi:endoglucanase
MVSMPDGTTPARGELFRVSRSFGPDVSPLAGPELGENAALGDERRAITSKYRVGGGLMNRQSVGTMLAFALCAAAVVTMPAVGLDASSTPTSSVTSTATSTSTSVPMPQGAPAGSAAATQKAAVSAPSQNWWDNDTISQLYPGGLWANPASQPATEFAQLQAAGNLSDAATISQISSQPIATWLGDSWTNTLIVHKLNADVAAAAAAGKTPVFVTYAIPDRDCGGYSAGGYTEAQYIQWNQLIANTLRGHPAVILMEPDSIAMLGNAACSSITSDRLALLNTITQYYAHDQIAVYLDGGNSNWIKPAVMAQRLTQAGVQYARGFFTNVSNFNPVSSEEAYASTLSGLLGGKHFVIDVSRDGNGSQSSWCNPPGAALGANPSLANGTTALDALLWVKTPGSSDGTCNSGPAAGVWFESYAVSLVDKRAAG